MNNDVILTLKAISKTFNEQAILNDFNLMIQNGEFFTILGPSGCGKTTVLRLIAGFESVDTGVIMLDNVDITTLPPEKRSINTVFQSYALFPHMTVFDNIAFGLKMKKRPKSEIKQAVNEVLKMIDLESHIHKKPHQLSGGQKQRVAIARAIINKPKILLLDESLSALDYKLRQKMQNELKQLQRKLGITFIYVTHDQEEALSMSDRILVLDHGTIQQIGTPREIYESPDNLFVASFIGQINVIRCTVLKKIEDLKYLVSMYNFERVIHTEQIFKENDVVYVLLRPEDLRIKEVPKEIDQLGFLGTIVEYNYKGKTLDSVIELDNGEIVFASEFFDEDDPDFDYSIGEKVWIDWVHGWEHVIKESN